MVGVRETTFTPQNKDLVKERMNQVIRKLTERVTKLESILATLKDPNKTQLDQFLNIIAEVRRYGPALLQAE